MFTVGMDVLTLIINLSYLFYIPFENVNSANIFLLMLSIPIKPEIAEDNNIKEILFGSLLGDGSLELPARGKNARFIFSQSNKYKPYFLHMFLLLNLFCSNSFKSYDYKDKRTNKMYTTLSFKTRALPIFTEFYKLFYINKVKSIPMDLSLLTPLALAHWIMDDGSKATYGGLYLCTEIFTFSDNQRLANYLVETYNLKVSLHKLSINNDKVRIYIYANSMENLRSLVIDHMHSSMLYKLGI
jgi:hypothetical protein